MLGRLGLRDLGGLLNINVCLSSSCSASTSATLGGYSHLSIVHTRIYQEWENIIMSIASSAKYVWCITHWHRLRYTPAQMYASVTALPAVVEYNSCKATLSYSKPEVREEFEENSQFLTTESPCQSRIKKR